MNRLRSLLLACGLCLAALTEFAPPALSQANVQGQWTTLPYTMPINPIHVALMYNGKVLVASGSGNFTPNTNYASALWDPLTGVITTQPVDFDMFCNGMVVLPDGRPFIVGGTIAYDPFLGASNSSLYNPVTNTFADQQNMAHGRWYPTTTVMGDGRVLVFSGLDESSATNQTFEIYSPNSGWTSPVTAALFPPLYPRLHLLPNGNLFYSGSTPSSWYFNPSSNTWTPANANTNYGGIRTYGSSVLFPLTPANGYKPKVIILGGGTSTTPATATTEIIDLSVSNPQWVYGPSMSAPRIEMDATLLPNGKILALGGSKNDEDATTAALNADLYDPATNSFSPAGTEAYPRLYHTVSLLLPDGTVWVAGGNPYRGNFENHMEIYSPAYLFNPDGSPATRPSITSISAPQIGYGGSLQVQTPDAANISTVVLMRNGSSSHAFDFEQRQVGLSFTPGSGVLTLTGPPNSNIAPPGYYMLFILNRSGVPSVSKMVQVTNAPGDLPPAGTITSPNSDVTINAGQWVSFSGAGSDPDGTVSAYYWSFPGGSPSSSNLANPGAVTYSTPGKYTAMLTVTDNQGVVDPNPPTRTITVQSGSNGSNTINFGTGFSAAGLQLNGYAQLNGTRLQVTNTTTSGESGSAFWTSQVNITNFTNNFTFQLTNAVADGMTFTIQGVSPTALGQAGGELGYAGYGKITPSVAVKFDLYSNAGEGNNSTGLYSNGADPTVPATTLGGGVNLHSGDIFQVQMTYDGTTLTMTITDQSVSGKMFTIAWPVNIPAILGTNTAYVGFTGGTGGGTATQEILTWTFNGSGGMTTATPMISPATGQFTSAQTVSITDSTSGATIYYTLDGTQPTTFSTQYTGSFQVSATTTVNAIAQAANSAISATATSVITIQGNNSDINFASGFTAVGLQLNGNAQLNGTRLQLTNTVTQGATGSAFWTTQVNVASFTNTFTFQLTNPVADGMTFTIQGMGPAALGQSGGELGYAGYGMITPSVAVKFDLYSNAGEGSNSTGLYSNGADPTVPATTLGGGVNLHSGDIFQAQMTYDGTTLSMTITDQTVPADTFTISWPVNMPQILGSSTGYVGFTGGTGGGTATQEILTWSYNGSVGAMTATPIISPATGQFTTVQTVTMTDSTSGATIYYTLDGTQPTTSSTKYTGSFPVSSTKTVSAMAKAANSAMSGTAVSVISIQSNGINFGSGFTSGGLQLNGNAQLNGTRLQLTNTATQGATGSAFWTTQVNVASFTNTFTFQLTNPVADGMTFTIQGMGPAALGQSGGELGYAGYGMITPSVAVKFDLYSNAGEGNNSTGLYSNGADPTVPATTLGGGVNLHSGDIFQVQMTYDGTTLSMTITDQTVPADTFTISWPVNIPQILGSSTGYVGFTGGTGGGTATQEILTWSYNGSVGAMTATPIISPATGQFTTVQTVTMTDSTSGATIYYTLDGTQPTTSSTKYTGSFPVSSTKTVSAMAKAANSAMSGTAVSVISIQSNGINFGSGFTSGGLQLNGNAQLNGTRLQLTNTVTQGATGSAFWTTQVNVASFTNTFTFQLTNPVADGMTFTIQGMGPAALGQSGGELGYAGYGMITPSVAVKFDLYSNAGEGSNSTGLYSNGADPTVPATTLGGGVNLHSGDIFQAQMTYDGTTLSMTITDQTVPADTFTISWPVNIPQILGSSTEYVGFTGGTGGGTATQEILTWSYNGTGGP